MNITIISLRGPTKNSVRGGAREYIEQISRTLIKNGHMVKILCGIEPKNKLYHSENIDGIEIIRVGKSRWPILHIYKYYLKNLRRETDILIENIVSFPMYFSLLRNNKKFFAIVHHLTDKEYFKTHNLLIAIIGYFMEKVSLRIFYKKCKFIAVSKYTKKMLIKDGIKSDLIEIINPGIIEGFFKPNCKSKNPLVFYIGRYSGIGGNKRVDHLIKAFRFVNNRYPDAELIIGGKGDNVDKLKDLSIGYNVKFLGLLTDEEKRDYMQKAWVFASPSLAEGFGITWIEANACGTPVVGYKIDGLDTVNEKTSIMVEKGDIRSLADAMIKIVDDKELLEKFIENGVIHAKNYGWSISGNKFCNIILKM